MTHDDSAVGEAETLNAAAVESDLLATQPIDISALLKQQSQGQT
ncbi:MAG TPA: hypothetical protein VIJ18_05125 [Microbacteriaceae bacterium]